ncbi:DUF397 domain-containing protein [Actinokineospora sp. NBRC 105648]|uniref:DUF397 domain-containing protein n=1 Tax=Actinokineospora sp. NBRC 105648 TaxID=3032206 RepID=UPI0024A3B92A|nr:DUF397 domain-containing protein [Actinokineospora sp. NBRC 105648]GLZ39238.1 hypothetical protein Acsp05_28620 [Actinokineospora sp. NBRC 105648]
MPIPTGSWRKSSFSGTESNCVELAWRKSSFSGTQSACVELAWQDTTLMIRDSKAPAGPTLEFTGSAITALLTTTRTR